MINLSIAFKISLIAHMILDVRREPLKVKGAEAMQHNVLLRHTRRFQPQFRSLWISRMLVFRHTNKTPMFLLKPRESPSVPCPLTTALLQAERDISPHLKAKLQMKSFAKRGNVYQQPTTEFARVNRANFWRRAILMPLILFISVTRSPNRDARIEIAIRASCYVLER